MEGEEPRVKYSLDLDWFAKNRRSLPMLLQARLCPSCQGKLTKGPEASEQEPSVESLLEIIRTCCSQSSDFFPPDLPLREAIFRLLLLSTEPLTVGELHEQLEARLGTAGDRRDISIKNLERLLQRSDFYGLHQLVPQAEH